MKKKHFRPTTTLALVSACFLTAAATGESITEFDKGGSKELGWRVVDDGVMGGLSKGKMQITDPGTLRFSGKLSLENNGGFSSLRTDQMSLDLSDAEGFIARVKGDGRTYQLRIGTDARFRGMEVSFKSEFRTRKGKWTEVKVPFDSFEGSFRGMSLKDEVFDPSKISRLGLLLADKNPGSFNLEVDWIRTYGNSGGSNDIVDVAVSDGRFKTLAAALGKAGLVDVLKGDGPFTVFAPTDEAFSQLPEGTVKDLLKPANRDKLQSILKFHVVPGSVDLATALGAGSADTVLGDPVKISFSKGQVTVNGSALVDADIKCGNGIIHVVDKVMLPPAPKNDIASVAKRAGKFGTLLAAVDAAGFTEALSGEGPITVFAPTDDAFAALPKGTVKSLLKKQNLDQLREILAMHAVKGKVSAGDALNAGTADALNGKSLGFGINNGTFEVNGVKIVRTDITCDNGVIHVIDRVILPDSGEQASRSDSSKESPGQRIQAAIDKGVPIFNGGDHDKCAAIYRECVVGLSKDEDLEPKVRRALTSLVERADAHTPTERAWMLRYGMDRLHSALAQ